MIASFAHPDTFVKKDTDFPKILRVDLENRFIVFNKFVRPIETIQEINPDGTEGEYLKAGQPVDMEAVYVLEVLMPDKNTPEDGMKPNYLTVDPEMTKETIH